MDNKDLEKLAKLARLKIKDGEREALIHALNDILGFVERLNTAEIENIIPLSHPLDMHQRLRSDEVVEADESERLREIAPDWHDNFYTVPKVLD